MCFARAIASSRSTVRARGGAIGRAGRAMPRRRAKPRSFMRRCARMAWTRAIVVGHSFGAAVAAALAIEHKSFVRGLVFVAPATHPWPGGVAWHYWLPAFPLFGTMFASLFAPIFGAFLLRPGIEAVFRPQTPPKDYARRAARRACPHAPTASREWAGCGEAQAPSHGALATLRRDQGALRHRHGRCRQHGFARHSFARPRTRHRRRKSRRARGCRAYAASCEARRDPGGGR